MELKDTRDCIMRRLIQEMYTDANQTISLMLRDINEAENDDESYAYLPLNTEVEVPVMKLVGVRAMLTNMLDGGSVEPSKIEVGASLLYAGGYTDKLESVIFRGGEMVKNIQHWILESPNTRGSSRGLIRSISTEAFKDQISMATDTSTRKLTDSRKLFADYFGLKKYSHTDDKHYIVLAPASLVNRIRKSKIKFGEQDADFGALIYSQLLKNTGAFENVRRTHHSFAPFLLFASSVRALSDYLIDNPSNIERIYIIGEKWWTANNKLWMPIIVSTAKDNNIPITILSSVGSVMTPDGMNIIKKIPAVYAWFDSSSDQTPDIRIATVTDSEKNMQSWKDIIYTTRQWQDDMSVVALIKWIAVYKQIYFSNIASTSSNESMMHERILDALNNSNFDTEARERLQNDLINLKNIDYAIALDNKLNDLGCGSDTLIVTSKYTFTELQDSLRKRGKWATVILYSEEITSEFYNKYSKIILVNPRASERRKWLLAGLGGSFVIIYPDLFWQQNKHSMNSDLSFIREIDQRDYLQDGTAKKIINAIILGMQRVEKESKMDEESVLEFSDSSLLEAETFNDDLDIETLPTGRKFMKEVIGESDAMVIANYLVKFSENKSAIVLGTPHGKVPVLENDRLDRISIQDLSAGDTIAYVKMDDCIDTYRKMLLLMDNDDDFRKQKFSENSYFKLDYEWKRILLNYVAKNELSPLQLKAKFAQFDYSRSIGFYQAWSNIKKINFVPRNMDFIGAIGDVCGAPQLKKNEEQYYQASILVRNKFQMKRQAELDRIESTAIKDFSYPISFLTVEKIEKVTTEVNRSKTNCLLENPEEELR